MVTATTPRAGQYFNVKRDGRYINAQIVRNASHHRPIRYVVESYSNELVVCTVKTENKNTWV